MTNYIVRKENRMKNQNKYILELWRDGRVVKARLTHRPRNNFSSVMPNFGVGDKHFFVADSVKVKGYSLGVFRDNCIILPQDNNKVLIKSFSSIREAKRKVQTIKDIMKRINCGVDCTIIHSK